MNSRIYTTLLMLLVPGILLAQQGDWEDDGEVEDAEIVIEKDKKIELPPFNRFYEKIKFDQKEQSPLEVKFEVKDLSFSPIIAPTKIRILRLKPPELEKLYNGQVQLGYGNFGSPFLDVMYANKRSDKVSVGAHVNHLSYNKGPVDDKNSGSGTSLAEVFAKGYTGAITYHGSINFTNRYNHFYGYSNEIPTPDRDSIRQAFNKLELITGISTSRVESPFRLNYEIGFATQSDNFEAAEQLFKFTGLQQYRINDDWTASLDISGNVSTYEDELLRLERNQFRFSPGVKFGLSKFRLHGGLNVFVSTDTTGGEAAVKIFPDLRMAFPISDGFEIYGGLRGDQSFTTWTAHSEQNQWIQQNLDVRNETKRIEVYGGLRGNLSDKAEVTFGFSTGSYENMAFLVNSQLDSSRFSLIYDDGNTTMFRLNSDFNYSFGDKAGLQASVAFNGYDTDQIAEAWHRPQYEFTLGGKYKLLNKVIIRPSLEVLGGIEGYNEASGLQKKLDPVMNLDIRTRYILSERSGLFLNFMNLLGAENQRYMNYPMRVLQVQGGFSYSF